MKVYTKTGDKGKTSLIGGKRVPKNNIRIEAYGTVDELISYLGLLRDLLDNEVYNDILVKIQSDLMTVASILATDCDDCKDKLPKLSEQNVVELENEIDKIDKTLPELRNFILPGGHQAVSVCHICRTVCRRAERVMLTLSEELELPNETMKYVNRLSDFLFMLGRQISFEKKVKEIAWKPGL